ncbi:MAG: hypothetical protein ABIG96_05610 [Candidatus Micrarchaeota archaeon]
MRRRRSAVPPRKNVSGSVPRIVFREYASGGAILPSGGAPASFRGVTFPVCGSTRTAKPHFLQNTTELASSTSRFGFPHCGHATSISIRAITERGL